MYVNILIPPVMGKALYRASQTWPWPKATLAPRLGHVDDSALGTDSQIHLALLVHKGAPEPTPPLPSQIRTFQGVTPSLRSPRGRSPEKWVLGAPFPHQSRPSGAGGSSWGWTPRPYRWLCFVNVAHPHRPQRVPE